jgi:hypothetical protein
MTTDPFERDGFLDEPGVVGARWWQKELESALPDPVNRRVALGTILGIGAGLAVTGLIVAKIASSDDDDFKTEPRNSLQMQREYGWNFGAHGDVLAFDGVTYQAWDPPSIERMADDCAPGSARHLPFWSPTLFQSPTAMPTKTAAGDPATGFKPLKDVLRPITTAEMDVAFARGRSLARLLERLEGSTLVVIDLGGPEAVAFAAGMTELFDPIFAFENWPHPRGVVPAHRTLAAAAFYQPLLAKARVGSRVAPPAIVLDRNRLAAYTDEQSQFDNRFVAKLPGVDALTAQGIKHVLYVTPFATDTQEMDDVNDDLVAWSRGGLDVAMLGATSLMLTSGSGKDATYLYGGTDHTHEGFYLDYPWAKAGLGAISPSPSAATRFKPLPRKSTYSTGSGAVRVTKTPPVSFGMVPVVILAATGVIQGAKLSRNGSWNRAGGGGWSS